MNKIIAKSRITEVNAAVTRMVGAYQSTALNTDTVLDGIMTTLSAKNTALTQAINRSKAESTLDEKDGVRDEKLRALNYLLMGLSHHPDAAIQSASAKILVLFDTYGVGITGESYATESSLLTSLLTDLSNADLAADIAAVPGCPDIISQLQAAQTDFENTRIAYEQNKAEEGTQLSATQLKKEIVVLVNDKIVSYLQVMELVNEPVYGAFARTVTEIIAENNETVKKRKTKTVAEEA